MQRGENGIGITRAPLIFHLPEFFAGLQVERGYADTGCGQLPHALGLVFADIDPHAFTANVDEDLAFVNQRCRAVAEELLGHLVLGREIVLPLHRAGLQIQAMQHGCDAESDDHAIANDRAAAWAIRIAEAVAILDGIIEGPVALARCGLHALDSLLVIERVKQHAMLADDAGAGVAVALLDFPNLQRACLTPIVQDMRFR